MNSKKSYEKYPIGFVIGANILQLLIYFIGAYIVYLIGPIWLILYVLYIIILEIRLLRLSCIHCYYYGKLCAFGRGKFCALFFKKGKPKKFIDKKITWKDIIPEFLLSIIPIMIGIALLIIDFNLILLFLIILLLILAFPANGYLRGALACIHCKQREIGCPAEQFFRKKNVKNKK
ncbi:hypothetical protein AYK21_05630 [Thermoplasmatales archaeon SG8-52-2]|nr:MAG: hypothetical protein AYK21_05630 [Thermoplasmatales archaeon SG8-52-2]